MRVAYAGTPEFAVPALISLAESRHNVCLVVTQPDRRAGRGKVLTPSPVKLTAQAQQISVFQPDNINSDESLKTLEALDLDVLVVAAYGQIFSTQLLSLPRLGCINIHASLLPRWRGASPIQHAILAGDQNSGVSIMQMCKAMDAGDVWLQKSCAIQDTDTAESLHDRLAELSGPALQEALEIILTQDEQAQPQLEDQVTFCKKLNKSDGEINWQSDGDEIMRQIRAYYPWPSAFSYLKGRRISISKAQLELTTSAEAPGKVLDYTSHGILVQCGQNAVRILELTPAGGKRVQAKDFANSNDLANAVFTRQ